MKESFSNLQVDISSLPTIDDIDYKGLHKDLLKVELIGLSIFWLLAGGGATASIIIFWGVWPIWVSWLALAVLILLLGFSFVVAVLGFRKKLFALREKDIIYKRGLLWRIMTILPFNRVQHAEVQQGVIDRLFNLSKLKIYTAGGSGSDLVISGLLPKEANRIKHYILNKTVLDEEE